MESPQNPMRTSNRLFALTLPALLVAVFAIPLAAQPGIPLGATAGTIATPRPAAPTQGALVSRAPSQFLGSVPQGTATADEIPLSLNDAIERGLSANLGA